MILSVANAADACGRAIKTVRLVRLPLDDPEAEIRS